MSKSTSLYLDMLRALAAIGVLFGHAGQGFFSQGLSWLQINGHHMVVIFFVLSGYVMSHSAAKVGANWLSYTESRFTRIASVAYPALVLTIVCDFVGRMADPNLYAVVAREEGYWYRILLSAVFLQQSGPFAASPGSNPPFWSLAYEVWYYVLLGAWTFIRCWRKRVTICVSIAIIAGPKIILLMPVWMAGLVAYQVSGRLNLPVKASLLVFGLTGCLILGVILDEWTVWADKGNWAAVAPWFFSTGFMADYQVGLLVAIHLIAVEQVMRVAGEKWTIRPLEKCVRFLADRSFSLYAFHMPLLYLISVTVPYQKSESGEVLLVLGMLGVMVGILHWFTEKRRNIWRILFRFLVKPRGRINGAS
jgi:peptidoglycan/LPS O-acetylase OafA/YrhL